MDFQGKVMKILFWIFFILFVIFAIWYIIGDSPTMEQLLFLFILGALNRQNRLSGKLINRIDLLEKDINEIKQR